MATIFLRNSPTARCFVWLVGQPVNAGRHGKFPSASQFLSGMLGGFAGPGTEHSGFDFDGTLTQSIFVTSTGFHSSLL
jgi:hypothetical protein